MLAEWLAEDDKYISLSVRPKEAAKTSKPRTYESRRDDAEGMGF